MIKLLETKGLEGNDTPSNDQFRLYQVLQNRDSTSPPSIFCVVSQTPIVLGATQVWQLQSYGTLGWVMAVPSIPQEEIEFQQQKEAFNNIPPVLLTQYQNQFVVSHNGDILDSDPDLPTLTERFFRTHGDMPIYITRVGEDFEIGMSTPFLV